MLSACPPPKRRAQRAARVLSACPPKRARRAVLAAAGDHACTAPALPLPAPCLLPPPCSHVVLAPRPFPAPCPLACLPRGLQPSPACGWRLGGTTTPPTLSALSPPCLRTSPSRRRTTEPPAAAAAEAASRLNRCWLRYGGSCHTCWSLRPPDGLSVRLRLPAGLCCACHCASSIGRPVAGSRMRRAADGTAPAAAQVRLSRQQRRCAWGQAATASAAAAGAASCRHAGNPTIAAQGGRRPDVSPPSPTLPCASSSWRVN